MNIKSRVINKKLSLAVVTLAMTLLCTGQIFALEPTINKSGIDWDSLKTYEHKLSGKALNITEAGTHTLTGKSTSSVSINSDGFVRLVLNGVDIRSTEGAAIQIDNADKAVIELAAGTENFLEDAAKRTDKDIDGVIYSSDDLIFQGSGKLTIKSNFEDGIVSKDDLVFFDGEYNINSIDDGIRGKDSLVIEGGVIAIIAKGDGIKSSNEGDAAKGNIHIKGGSLTIECDDDGIKAVNNIIVDGGTINVSKSLEGMEAAVITINDGDIRVYADDDGINAANNNYSGELSITVNGGNVDVTVGSGDTDAFDSNGSILITGGNIKVTAPTSSFDADRGTKMTGGTLVVNGETLDDIPTSRRGRGGRGGRGMGGS